jgi:hypothetical protein
MLRIDDSDTDNNYYYYYYFALFACVPRERTRGCVFVFFIYNFLTCLHLIVVTFPFFNDKILKLKEVFCWEMRKKFQAAECYGM